MRGMAEQLDRWLPFSNSLLFWALVLGGLGLWLRVALQDRPGGYFSRLLGVVSLVLLGLWLPRFGGWAEQIIFWLLAGVAVLTAGTAISTRSPVYMAIWFALSLLATAGLFLFQGAQFVGFATIVIYAGAIVVTFLFVLMLAQSEGYAVYDRVSWSWFAAPMALLAGGVLLGVLLLTLIQGGIAAEIPGASAPTTVVGERHHMASLGGELYARHLVAVEVAGTILLVALVGAIAIVIHGKAGSTMVASQAIRRSRPEHAAAAAPQSWQGGPAA